MDSVGQLVSLDEQERRLFALLQVPVRSLESLDAELLRAKWNQVLEREEPEALEILRETGGFGELLDYAILFEAIDVFLRRKKAFLNKWAPETALADKVQFIRSMPLRAALLHRASEDALKRIYSLYLWWNRGSGERFLGRPHMMEMLAGLKKGLQITQANRETVQLKYRADALIQDEVTVWLTVHAGERVAEDFENEAVTYSAAEPVLLNFVIAPEDEQILLEVRTARNKIVAPFIQWLNENSGAPFTRIEDSSEPLTEDQQLQILESLGQWPPHPELTLSAMSFASTALPGTPKMGLTESSPAGISAAIHHLTTSDLPILDGLSLATIESFSVRWGKSRQRTVRRKFIDDLSLVFYIQDAEMVREEVQKLAELIELVFRVPIGKVLSIRELRGSRSLLIDHVLSQSTDEHLDGAERGILEELCADGFIARDEAREFECSHCGHRGAEDECPNCMEPTREITYNRLRPDLSRLEGFLKASLPGQVTAHQLTVGYEKLTYLEYQHKEHPVRLFGLIEPPSRAVTHRLHADLVPVVYVVMGRLGVVQQRITPDRSAVMVSFVYLWDSPLACGERLLQAIDEGHRLMSVQREQAIHEAYNRFAEGRYGTDNQAFERDSFLLLLRVLSNGFKLGGAGKRRPDAIFVSTVRSSSHNTVSIYSMDAKWSEGQVDLNSYEKLKADDYVNRIASLPEARDHAAPTAHILVGPKFSVEALNNAYQLVKQKNTGWAGNLVGIDTGALLHLVRSWFDHKEQWDTRLEMFRAVFDQMVRDSNNHYVDEAKMDKQVSRILSAIPDGGQPTARSLGDSLN